MRIALDSNILIRLVVEHDPNHAVVAAAVEALAGRGDVFCAFPQNVAEFWNVCTRPATARGGYGKTVREVESWLAVIEERVTILPDTPDVYAVWRRLVSAHAVQGVQVHDAKLVAAMTVHGVSDLLTLNADDFRRYAGITAVTPATVVGPPG